MSSYLRRWAPFPRPGNSTPDRRRLSLHGLGQAPNTHDVMNSYPMPPTLGADSTQDPTAAPTPRPSLPVWLYPPVNWENIDLLTYALLPAIGATVTIVSFTVPIGRNGVINKVACNFVGGGWVEGSGDVIWRVLVDGSTPPGATTYDAIVASLGSPAQPVGISGFRIYENQTLTLVAFNNAVVVAGQRVGARLCGHLYPREEESADIWI